MSATLRPKGPLPARVYWVRRALVFGVPLVALLVLLATVIGGGSDGKDAKADDAASLASGQTGGEDTTTSPTTGPTRTPVKETKPPLAEPSGECDPADVVVTPSVPDPITKSGLTINLAVKSVESEACWFTVSPTSVSVGITSGKDDIWASRHCADAIAEQRVVARPTKAGEASFVWNLRRSDAECSDRTDWARLGYYHVTAAALGGEPDNVQFRLSRPPAEVITKTVEPKQKDGKKDRKESGSTTEGSEEGRHVEGDDGPGVSEPDE